MGGKWYSKRGRRCLWIVVLVLGIYNECVLVGRALISSSSNNSSNSQIEILRYYLYQRSFG